MINQFIFEKYYFNEKTGELVLVYLADDKWQFEERIVFPKAPFSLTEEKTKALDKIFALLHIAAGISYYKAVLPKQMILKAASLSAKQAAFFETFYLSGLGQFAVENNLNLQGKINFPFDDGKKDIPFNIPLKKEVLVPVGGGKDSCVTMALLKKTSLPLTLFSVNTARAIQECKTISHLPEITVQRTLSEVLLKNNESFYNGHVPITGIIAFILLAASVLYDKQYVAMSCERSADEANMKQGALDVNHQWSKSTAFETAFYELTQQIVPSFRYFSLLRPYSEMKIASLFAQLCAPYVKAFTSCNAAFKLDKEKRLDRWCGHCDKCRFVFLILAPFMEKEELIAAVGTNPLNEANQEAGYRALLGMSGHKPFECVGTYDECRLAFLMLSRMPTWRQDVLVQKLAPLIDQEEVALKEKVMAVWPHALIPKEFQNVLD